LAAAAADFAANADTDGKIAERFEIIYVNGWAPSPDQPQPARRGSATTSLAAALKPPSR
jgi:NADH dehydrogenase [ubiquinone] 1 alpha subcomplex assembly factor 5